MNNRRNFLRRSAALGLSALCMPAFGADFTNASGAGSIVTASGAGSIAPAAAIAKPARLIIDAMGGIFNINLPTSDKTPMRIDARALADARASGLTAFNGTIGYVFGDGDPYQKTVKEVQNWTAFLRDRADALLLVRTAADIKRAHSDGRIGVILGFQNAAMMGDDAGRVADFAADGVRVIQLTYNGSNQLGDGSMAPANRGLTPFGHEVLEELNRHRVLVDLSHSGERICLDATAASSRPVAITHTGCRAIADLPRNKTDRELKLVADKGGFVGIYFMPFLAIGRQPMAADLVAHIEHAVNVCGEDHVGIGSDGAVPKIDDMAAYMKGLAEEIAQRRAAGIGATGERADIVPFLPDLTGKDKFHTLAALLAKRGHSESRIDKIMGANFLRVAGDIWG